MRIVDEAVEAYAYARTKPESDVLQALAAETKSRMERSGMLSGRVEGRLLQLLLGLVGARRVLEIGTFTGYSALAMAEALPEDGEVVTCDVDPEATTLARAYWARSPAGRKIDLRLGPALETLETLGGGFDFAFIDADKPNYGRYYEAVVPKLRVGGVVAVDNALWSGGVLNASDESSRVIDALNRRMEEDPRVQNVLLTVRDGIHLAVRRA